MSARRTFEPQDPEYEARVRESFAAQSVMGHIGATLTRVAPGEAEITLPYRNDLTQQDGFIHAGIVGTIADSAGGYAGFTLMPADSRVLSVEYKMNLLSPAAGDRFVATGRVVRAGRRITVCELEVESESGGARKTCAWGLQTLMCVRPGD